MKTIITFLSCIILSVCSIGQTVICNVKGTVEYSENGQWKKVTAPRQNIRDNTRLRFADKSSCIVVSAKKAELITAEKSKEVTAGAAAVEEETMFAKVWATLNGLMSDPSKKGGANIFRGENLMLLPADGEILLQPSFGFLWRNNNSISYDFFLQEDPTEVWLCKKIPVADTILSLTGNIACAKNLSTTKKYYWGVKPASNTSEECYMVGFSFVTPLAKAALEKRVADIKSKQEYIDGDVYEVLLASVYFDQRFYYEAYKILLAAKQKYPGSEIVATGYNTLIHNLTDLNTDSHEDTGK